ncbi:MAG: 50S ribosomal protein L9 [Myxococcota bacterium]
MGRASVDVILKEDVDNLGTVGDVVRVRPGYFRNYLLPRGLVAIATSGSVKQLEHEKRNAKARAQKLRHEASEVAAALAKLSLQIEKRAGAEGKLYGSVTAQEVADLLKSKGYEVDRRKIEMPSEAIKSAGEYSIAMKLTGGIHATCTLVVSAAPDA